jgi:magnesium transporter
VLTVRAVRAGGVVDTVEVDAIDALLGDPAVVVWADLVDPTGDDEDAVCREFGLHALSVEDLRKHRQRPKVDRYEDHVVLVAYGIATGVPPSERGGGEPSERSSDAWLASLSTALAEVDVVVGERWVLTVRERSVAGVVDLGAAVAALRNDTRSEPSVGLVVHVVADVIVDGYFDLTDDIDRRLADIEDLIFAADDVDESRGVSPSEQDRRDRTAQRSMLVLRNDLVLLRRRLAPLYDVLQAVLRGEAGSLDREVALRFQDVVDHVLRVTETIDVHHELLSNAFDAHLALVAQHTNDTMRRMTAWGSILLGATLIAGIYGMNFDTMPELRWSFGYPLALGSMVVLSLALWLMFRRRRWL